MKKSFLLLLTLIVVLCGCNNGENQSSAAEEDPEVSTDYTDSYGETAEKNLPQTSDVSKDLTLSPPEEGFPFPGMGPTGETPTVGNLPANAKEMGTNAFFCCDEDGKIYYADLTDGGYLYHLNNGKPEKLVDLPASWITAVFSLSRRKER